MRLLRPSTWAARCFVAATVLLAPVAFVASCESFDSTSSNVDAGAEASFPGDAGPADTASDAPITPGEVRCHTGDLLYNVGFEAAGCGTSLEGNGARQSPVPGHDSATACVVCGTSGPIKATSPSLRQSPLKPGQYVAEAWVRSASLAADAGSFAKLSLTAAIYPASGTGGYLVPGGQTAPSGDWACISTKFEVPADAGAGANIGLYVEGSVGTASGRDCFEVDDFGIYPALDGGLEPCTCH